MNEEGGLWGGGGGGPRCGTRMSTQTLTRWGCTAAGQQKPGHKALLSTIVQPPQHNTNHPMASRNSQGLAATLQTPRRINSCSGVVVLLHGLFGGVLIGMVSTAQHRSLS